MFRIFTQCLEFREGAALRAGKCAENRVSFHHGEVADQCLKSPAPLCRVFDLHDAIEFELHGQVRLPDDHLQRDTTEVVRVRIFRRHIVDDFGESLFGVCGLRLLGGVEGARLFQEAPDAQIAHHHVGFDQFRRYGGFAVGPFGSSGIFHDPFDLPLLVEGSELLNRFVVKVFGHVEASARQRLALDDLAVEHQQSLVVRRLHELFPGLALRGILWRLLVVAIAVEIALVGKNELVDAQPGRQFPQARLGLGILQLRGDIVAFRGPQRAVGIDGGDHGHHRLCQRLAARRFEHAGFLFPALRRDNDVEVLLEIEPRILARKSGHQHAVVVIVDKVLGRVTVDAERRPVHVGVDVVGRAPGADVAIR